jgi:uncharacterized membrane protein
MEHGAKGSAGGLTGLEALEFFFKQLGGYVALGVEILAALLILWGAIEAVLTLLGVRRADPRPGMPAFDARHPFQALRWVFIRFGSWLLLALEFELAADVIRSAIAPTWSDIGKLAAIAAVRTVLNYFLEKDIDSFSEGLTGTEDVARGERARGAEAKAAEANVAVAG